jgi:hypothetical protein
MCSFNSAELSYLEQTEPTSTLQHHGWKKISVPNLTQLAQENNVLDASASNMHGVVLRNTWLSNLAE